MAKASPLLRAFNGGEHSELIAGRTDLDKYPMLMRRSINYIPTAQGPAIRRSGTVLQAPTYSRSLQSYFIEFQFSNDAGQSYMIEAAHLRFRWHSEAGLLAKSNVAVTAADASAPTVKLTAPGHSAVVNDEVVLSGFEPQTNLNGRVGTVTVVVGNVITTNIPKPAVYGSLAAARVAAVYHIVSPYTNADVSSLRFVGDRNDLYLFCPGYEVRKLTRYGATDWRLVTVEFIDGPYDNINDTTTRLTATSNGVATPVMTANNLPAGYLVTPSTEAVGREGFCALNQNGALSFWEPTTDQAAKLQFTFPAAVIIDGYSFTYPRTNDDASYKALDYAPGTWTFEANDGVNWIVLDSKIDYVGYQNQRTQYFRLKNNVAYAEYRLNITQTTRNGPLRPRIAEWNMTSRASSSIQVFASSVLGINNDGGFSANDTGRQIRFQCDDGLWRQLKITGFTSTVQVTCEVLFDALSNGNPTTEWRLGLFSPGTGFPTCATFFEDRLVMGGVASYPDWITCSVTGKYTTIQQTDPDGTVRDDNGIVVRANARKLGRIVWIGSDNRSLLLGTGSGEWQVSSADLQAALTARTAKARRISARGSANVEPANVDRQLLYVQRGLRTLREMSYSFDVDGYKTPSMSMLASHFGMSQFAQIAFASEPHAIAWVRAVDGSLFGFTYNREENVFGWHRHPVGGGGFVECIATMPALNGLTDDLWLIVRRTNPVDGIAVRTIERMAPTWDFNSSLTTACFADCAVRYQGVATGTIYGLYMYEGRRLVGLADGAPIVPQTVSNGSITLADGNTATNIVLGLGYDSLGETTRIEAGAADGTAQGKEKRITGAVLRLWQSGGGKFGTRKVDDTILSDLGDELEALENVDWLSPETVLDTAPPLFTGDTKKLPFPGGYNQSGTIIFGQSGDIPLPHNVIAIMPQLITQDR